MGAGKSVVGRALAARLAVSFVDIDQEIGDVAGLFATGGEPAFRECEYLTLSRLVCGYGVIALGGGTLAYARNRELLRGWRVVVLMGQPNTLADRLGAGDGRPLVNDWQRLLIERMPSFLVFGDPVHTDGISVQAVVAAVVERVS